MLSCPECGNSEQSLFIGHEIRGAYDGVLVWQCRSCGWAFPRDFQGMPHRTAVARDHAARINVGASVGPDITRGL
jgi:rubredoxin